MEDFKDLFIACETIDMNYDDILQKMLKYAFTQEESITEVRLKGNKLSVFINKFML